MIRLTISLALGILACACSQPQAAQRPPPLASQPVVEEKPSIDLSTVEITLSRTECYGWCPNYEVTIKGTGEVHYVGRSFVKERGDRTGTIPTDAVLGLVKQFTDAEFLSLNKQYSEPVSDCASTFLSLKIGDKSRRVENYWGGSRIDLNDQEVPDWKVHELLDSLAATIDRVVGVESWIGTEDERRSAFQQSPQRGEQGRTSPR